MKSLQQLASVVVVESPLFIAALTKLPTSKQHAVVTARAAWVTAGLSLDRATVRAVKLAERMQLQRVLSLQRLRRRRHAQPLLHKAADTHEAHVTRLLSTALTTARAALGTREELEHLIRSGDRSSLDALASHASGIIKATLQDRLADALLNAVGAGGTVSAQRLSRLS